MGIRTANNQECREWRDTFDSHVYNPKSVTVVW
jgi:hypothetical protein